MLLTLLVTAKYFPALDQGYDACPCVDPYPLSGPGTGHSNCSGILRGRACYPSGYGARGCRAYDNSEFSGGDAPVECQAETPPRWCTDLWCYVAPWNCHKPHHESKFFAGAKMANATLLAAADSSDTTALTYSYETCGNVGTFTYEEGLTKDISEIAARGPLRIAIPGNEPPYITTVKPGQAHVEGTSLRDGSIPRFFAQLLDEVGLAWVEVNITAESRAYSPDSSFTACVHDVALNNTDLCWGSFWAFEYRRRLSPFTAALEHVGMYVIAPRASDDEGSLVNLDELRAVLGKPFTPFVIELWAVLLFALGFAGWAMYTLDATGWEDDEDDDEPLEGMGEQGHALEGLTAEQKRQLKWMRKKRHIFCPATWDDTKDITLSMTLAIHTFTGGVNLFKPRSAQSWTVFLGLTFMITVLLANYTAQVTAQVVVSATTAQISSLQEGVSRGWTFCGWSSLQAPMEAKFPELRGRYVKLENGHDVFQAMDRGECNAGIIDELAWELAQGGAYSLPEDDERYANYETPSRYHCDTKVMLPGSVFDIDIACPVRADLERLISWRMTLATELGKWNYAEQRAKERFVPPSVCDKPAPKSAHVEFGAGAGAILVSIMMTVLGLLCNGAWRCSPAQRRERRRLVEVERKYLEAKAAVEKVTEKIEAEEDAAELAPEFEKLADVLPGARPA